MKVRLTVSVLVMMGCAGQRAASTKCDPVPDSFAAVGVVYRDCAVDRPAVPPVRPPRLEFRPTNPGTSCFRAVIDVVIDTAGRPVENSATMVRSTNAEFGAAVLASLSRYRFEPAMKDGVPVQQLVRIDQAVQAIAVVSSGGLRTPARPPSRPSC